MTRLIALSILLCTVAFNGDAFAGKFNGGGARVHNPPMGMSGLVRPCSTFQHLPGSSGVRCVSAPDPKPVPHGGCGYYGPNGVLIKCE